MALRDECRGCPKRLGMPFAIQDDLKSAYFVPFFEALMQKTA
jgi:hypothetical protein